MGRGGVDNLEGLSAGDFAIDSEEFDLALVKRFTLIRMDGIDKNEEQAKDPLRKADFYRAILEMGPDSSAAEWHTALEEALVKPGQSWSNLLAFDWPDDHTVTLDLEGKNLDCVVVEIRKKLIEFDLPEFEDFDVERRWH